MRRAIPLLLLFILLAPLCPAQSVTANAATGPQLSAFRVALANCRHQVVSTNVYADSRSINTLANTNTVGFPTLPNIWPRLLRSKFLSLGCPSHGTGIVPFISRAGSATLNADYYATSGTIVLDQSTGPYQGADVPSAGSIGAGAGAVVAFDATSSGIEWDHLNVYCLAGPDIHAWNVSIDGLTVGTCGGSAPGTRAALAGFAAPGGLGLHPNTRLTCSANPCGGYGVQGTAGTVGIEINNLAVGSTTAEWWGLNPPAQFAYVDLLPGGHQLDLIMEITNEPGVHYSPASFLSSLTNIIDHDRALASGAPSVLLIAPMQDGIANQGAYYPVIRAAAAARNGAYVDMRDQMGAAQILRLYVNEGGNYFHENTEGNAVEAQIIAAALLGPRAQRQLHGPPATRPAAPGLTKDTVAPVSAGVP
jgi:hypothetical protein